MTTNFANTPTGEAPASQDNFFWMKIEDFATQIRICSLKARCGTVSPKNYQKILDITKKIQSEIASHLNQVSKTNPKAFPNIAYPYIFPESKELSENNGTKNEFNDNSKFSDLKTQNTPYLPPPNFSHTFSNTSNYNFIPNNSLNTNQGNNSIISSQTNNNNNNISTTLNSTSSNPTSTNNSLNSSQNLNITVVQHDLDNLPIVNGNNVNVIDNKDDKYSFTSQLFDKNLSAQKRQKRKRKNKELDRVCSICETSDTPEWRRGPLGPRTLCNACGLKWSKKVKTESNQKPDFSNLELTQPIEIQGSTTFPMQTNPIPIALLGPHIPSTKPEDFTFHSNM